MANTENTCTNGECTFTCFDGYEEISNACYPEGNAPFISVWDIKNDNTTLYFPIQGRNGTIVIDWGDGTSDTVSSGTGNYIEHTYSTANLYAITVKGTINKWSCSKKAPCQDSYCTSLIEIQSYGSTTFGKYTFCKATKLESLSTKYSPRFYNNEMIGVFAGAFKFNQNINFWNTSNITNMNVVFQDAANFNQSLESWDTSNVTNMEGMFNRASKFNQPLNNWNTSSVTNMNGMFYGASRFNQKLNQWDTSNVTNMGSMFHDALYFNQPLDNWNTSNVTNMGSIFYGASSFNQELNTWDISNVTNMYGVFERASSFNQPLNKWDTSNVTIMSEMFYDAKAFNQPLEEWDTSIVTDMNYMFYGAAAFNQPLDNWDISVVTNMSNMFLASGLQKENYCKLFTGAYSSIWKYFSGGLGKSYTCP